LLEAESAEGVQFGNEHILQLLQSTEPDRRFDVLMNSLDSHLCGLPAHDDISLAMANIIVTNDQEQFTQTDVSSREDGTCGSNWRVAIRLGEEELKHLDAVSFVTQIVSKIAASAEHNFHLYLILNELFNNALDHGLLQLDSSIKHGPDGFEKYLQLREDRLRTLTRGSIEIEIEKVMIEGRNGVKIHLADSGNGFDYSAIQDATCGNVVQGQYGRGLTLARSAAHKLVFSGRGNEVTAYYVCN
jgi:hypothetical protein